MHVGREGLGDTSDDGRVEGEADLGTEVLDGLLEGSETRVVAGGEDVASTTKTKSDGTARFGVGVGPSTSDSEVEQVGRHDGARRLRLRGLRRSVRVSFRSLQHMSTEKRANSPRSDEMHGS